jgi:DNA-directed RNA polymerase I, II, and III subunit RPABC1
MEFDEKTNYYKIRKTVLKMLEDRGYVVSIRDKNESLENFKRSFRSAKEDLKFIAQKSNDPTDTLYVEYNDTPKLGVGDINNFAEVLHGQKIKTGIIINKGAITPLAKMVTITKLENE